MGRRTNEFQQLVLLLQNQLASQAEVGESVLLSDSITSSPVEVDIVITARVNGVAISIGFECTASGRPATVEWVHQMCGKHSSIAIDKTVLVSKNGFSADAVALANGRGMVPLSLGQAEAGDWSGLVGGLSDLHLALTKFEAHEHKVTIAEGDLPGGLDIEAPIRLNGAEGPHHLKDYAESLIHRPDLFEQVIQKWLSSARPASFKFAVRSNLERRLEIQAADGTWRTASSFASEVKVTVEDVPLELAAGRIDGNPIAFTTAPNVFREEIGGPERLVINLLGGGGGRMIKAGLLIPAADGEEARYIDMRRAAQRPQPSASAGEDAK